MLARYSFALAFAAVAVAGQSAAAPEPPRLYVDTAYVSPSGRTIVVAAGGNLQAALSSAQPGDVITLEQGATFTGPFTLPAKSGSGPIVVWTSAPDGVFPPPGRRVDPSLAGLMPKLVAASGTVITAARGAHDYRFVGLEIRPTTGAFLQNLVVLGSDETSIDQVPHHIVFDRCYIHGDARRGARRGIALNARHAAVVDSYLSDFKEAGADSQAIAGWNGPGPFKIANNYLEGAGENLMFGGSDPSVTDLVPSDIEIRGNHFSKPLAWKRNDPAYAGTGWTVKNLLELKNARRVLIEGNLLEYNWADGQSGFAVLFTVRNQDGRAPWSAVGDVAFVNNVVRGVGAGINILGTDDIRPSQRTKRILIRNNFFLDIGGERWGGGGTLFQILNGTSDVVIDHNTAFQAGNVITAEGPPNTDFVFTNNIVAHNAYGIAGTGTGPGGETLDRYFPEATVKKNVIVGGRAAQYPKDNFFPSSPADVRFEDLAAGRHRLADKSAYRRVGLDGADLGADVGALPAALRAATNHRP
jgi:hypothetical protein